MSDQENLEIVQEWIAAINDHDADRLAATLDEDFVWELGESSTKGRDCCDRGGVSSVTGSK